MNRKNVIVAVLAVCCIGVILASLSASRPKEVHRQTGQYEKTVAGFKVRLVAVGDPVARGRGRLADHSWEPTGVLCEGSERRLSPPNLMNSPAGALRRCVVFEIVPTQLTERNVHAPNSATEPTPETAIDVLAYMPGEDRRGDDVQNPSLAGPTEMKVWHGGTRDSQGHLVVDWPGCMAIELGVRDQDPQPITLGIAQGEFKTIANGSASLGGIDEGQSKVIASGEWGRIEASHPKPPEFRPACHQPID